MQACAQSPLKVVFLIEEIDIGVSVPLRLCRYTFFCKFEKCPDLLSLVVFISIYTMQSILYYSLSSSSLLPCFTRCVKLRFFFAAPLFLLVNLSLGFHSIRLSPFSKLTSYHFCSSPRVEVLFTFNRVSLSRNHLLH